MKKVLNPNEVAHTWANQIQDEGRTSNSSFYFDGGTIYSYGGHFPIATHHKGIVLFTLRTYSNTTAKHISKVRSAVSHLDKIFCYNPKESSQGYHSNTISYFINNILAEGKKLAKAKKPVIYLDNIAREKQMLQTYLDFFNTKLSKTDATKIAFTSKEVFIKATEKANKIQAAIEKKSKANGAKVSVLWADFFREGKGSKTEFYQTLTSQQRNDFSSYGYDNNDTYLTVKNDDVMTSKGIKLPIAVAKRYFDFYNRIVSNGGCTDNCNYKMLEFEVKEATAKNLVVGCHTISANEIKLLANKLNWL